MSNAIFLSLFVFASSFLWSNEEIQIKTFRGEEITPYTKEFIQIVDQIYREYPYLYNGDDKEYEDYLASYSKTKEAMICFAFEGKEVIGIAAGMPMSMTRKSYQKPLLANSYKLDSLFYLGEFGLKPEYHGKGIEEKMYQEIENFALAGQFKELFLFEVESSKPVAKKSYIPQNDFWKKNGFIRHPELNFVINWVNINEKFESPHLAIYWIKKLTKDDQRP